MHHLSLRLRLAVCMLGLGLGGCITSQNTRLPTLAYGDPRAERQAFAAHDPLPENDIGPAMSDRPRGFDIARSEPRRTLEQSKRGRAQLNAATPATNSDAPVVDEPISTPPPSDNYPQSVRP